MCVPKILRSVDKVTANFSISNFKLMKDDVDIEALENGERAKMVTNYWDLYIARCKHESKNIVTHGWLTSDDIMSASPTSMLAIPGVTIVAILVDSIKISGKDKTLIYWNEENKCRDFNRDFRDNVANVFWAQVMKIKESLMSFEEKELEACSMWISASLCDGEDNKTDQLKQALDDGIMESRVKQRCLKTRATVENMVHSLLRVNAMTSRMNEIFIQDLEVEGDEKVSFL